MPNNVPITACSWNRRQGYVAAGSEASLIKVIKLEMTEGKTDSKAKNPPPTASLVMNESLEGHTGLLLFLFEMVIYIVGLILF